MLPVSNVRDLKRKGDIDALISALQYQDDTAVRAKAALSLGQFGDIGAVDSLISILQDDPDPYVRSVAATALGNLGDVRAERALFEALDNDCIDVSIAAGESQGKFKS